MRIDGQVNLAGVPRAAFADGLRLAAPLLCRCEPVKYKNSPMQ